ncbi:uncharacterized protein TrAtP1_012255 [Trichoderma atroviride]|uniref:uncharacterized protein n=1 Tax=Hypocrea atroviridis TaxID=63577 RepID=UPI00332C9694|nr:hypothetical protein TrAtP1_012255 [Trichoderma atroviride]
MERPSRSPTTSEHETKPPHENVSEKQDADSPAKIPETQWQWLNKLQEEHDTPISDENRRRLEQELTADTCKIYINHLKEKYEKERGSKFMNAIKPVVEGLKAYTDGLNTLTKNALGLSITWGVIQLILECAGHSYKILGHIAKLIGTRTHTLSLFIEYSKDFIGYPRLDKALVSMYMAYLDTCIRAANFLEKSASANFFRGFFWGGKKSRGMEKVMDDLMECFKIVKREVSYAKHQRGHARRQEDHARHQRNHAIRCEIQTMAAFQGPSKWYMMQEHKGWPDAKMLPLNRRVKYYSRDEEIVKAQHHLSTGHMASDCNIRVCVIHGMFGVGKTQLALEIACQWEGPVFWLNAETPIKLKESLDEIARILRLDVEPGMHGKDLGNLAKQWLATHNGWLLIYDDLTSFDDMAGVYWPTLSQGSVLVTARSKNLSLPPDVQNHSIYISLPPLTGDSSKAFLKENLGHHEINDDDLERISTLLGGSLLALAHVVECIKAHNNELTDVNDAINALNGCNISAPDIWSLDHRQVSEDLPSWPYERLPREALDQALFNLDPSTLPELGALVILDLPTPLTMWPAEIYEELKSLFDPSSNCLMIDDEGFVAVHPIVKLDIRRRFHLDGIAAQAALDQAKETQKWFRNTTGLSVKLNARVKAFDRDFAASCH